MPDDGAKEDHGVSQLLHQDRAEETPHSYIMSDSVFALAHSLVTINVCLTISE